MHRALFGILKIYIYKIEVNASNTADIKKKKLKNQTKTNKLEEGGRTTEILHRFP